MYFSFGEVDVCDKSVHLHQETIFSTVIIGIIFTINKVTTTFLACERVSMISWRGIVVQCCLRGALIKCDFSQGFCWTFRGLSSASTLFCNCQCGEVNFTCRKTRLRNDWRERVCECVVCVCVCLGGGLLGRSLSSSKLMSSCPCPVAGSVWRVLLCGCVWAGAELGTFGIF